MDPRQKHRRILFGILIVAGLVALGTGIYSLRVPRAEGGQQIVWRGLVVRVPQGAQVLRQDEILDVSWCRAPKAEDPDCYYLHGPNRLAIRELPKDGDPYARLEGGPVIENSRLAAEPIGPEPSWLPRRLSNDSWLWAAYRSERGEMATDGFLEGTMEYASSVYRIECYEGAPNEQGGDVDGSWCLPWLSTINLTVD